MKVASVLGAGEMGKACALALAADGAAAVRLLTRDAVHAALDYRYHEASTNASASTTKRAAAPQWPPAIRFYDVQKMLRDDAGVAECTKGPLFICTPITAYLPSDDAWAKAALGEEHSAVTHDVLQCWQRVNSPLPSPAMQTSTATPFVCLFTRGFTADGDVPAQLTEKLLNGGASASTAVHVGTPRRSDKEIPVVVAAAPLLAKEWALQCTPITINPDVTSSLSSSSPHSSSIPPRPQSALSDETVERGIKKQLHLVKNTTAEAAAPASLYPHAFSGVSLSFAAWSPSIHSDAGRQAALAQQLKEMLPRESITYLREPDAAAVLSIVNGCVPLCAFGAGLVSSVYTGASVSALASYAQHATLATEELVNQLLDRPSGTPLPIAAWSTLNGASTSLASREFALGRRFDFYFRKQDAVQAIFRGHAHQLFAATVDGLHTRMQTSSVASPFYEALMDTYNTMIRASRAGEGLVKEGYYGYNDAPKDEGVLLRHALQVDEAMLSGDEDRFTAAKERLVKAFPGAVVH
ncbi:hypothetical protein ABB37_04816 [Leptomonas pyrrhocoris]|uniref:Uncharacterized protein n=1 Tax=Leptomonas pyrrhocoris TaxID=157538 RepID=A0A0N0VF99_LEPPY|nr:hypothetical protein ABB37_04816 [Leptomonas pyrrhocoris]XP_015659063.1 hypothetical protein ABB37_04816 [Leptomonas pyrrhocoris]KPA80623.1 hypothetical protein ABB37_04816 [Leptomonas pyrrhocoris]KPA80624.1 hypothetical protein ABB37_04816 [Leptomonas pyrrhocoris]|eukprot:XP_015659062.1 hypothetical protein ABB37_04816 [Leptomonas pyrrhocoris]